MKLITVVIPTYNRPVSLKNTVSLIMRQWSPEIEVIVSDNQSSNPALEVLLPFFASEIESGKLQIVRNTVNIGADANIVRAIEIASGNYVWVLSDDDPPASTALHSILSLINSNPNAVLFNFSTKLFSRDSQVEGVGLVEFVDKLDSFSNLLLISASVYKIELLRKFQHKTYTMLNSHCQNLASALQALQDGASFIFSDLLIVGWGDQGNTWIASDVYYKIPSLVDELSVTKKTTRLFLRKISYCLPTHEYFLYSFLKNYMNSVDDRKFIYKRRYELLVDRLYRYECFQKTKYIIYKYFFLAPGFFLDAIDFMKKVKKYRARGASK